MVMMMMMMMMGRRRNKEEVGGVVRVQTRVTKKESKTREG